MAKAPLGTQPIPTTKASSQPSQHHAPAFQTPGSSSGPSIYPTAPRTSSNDLSYPRYERGTSESVDDGLRLKPNRRPLIIGLGVGALGLIIVLAMSFSGRSVEPVAAPATADDGSSKATMRVVGSDAVAPAGSAAVVAPTLGSATKVAKDQKDLPTDLKDPTDLEDSKAVVKEPDPKTGSNTVVETGSGSDEGSAVQVVDGMIAMSITSEPSNADVLIDGKYVGPTPFTHKRKRGSGSATMVVHHKGYQDNVARIDLGGDITKTIPLKKTETTTMLKDPKDLKDPKTTPVKDPKTTAVKDPKTPVKDPKTPVKDPKTGLVRDPRTTPVKDPRDSIRVVPPKKNCQPPGQIDPFDSRPPCAK